jgi:hypothetical protein
LNADEKGQQNISSQESFYNPATIQDITYIESIPLKLNILFAGIMFIFKHITN